MFSPRLFTALPFDVRKAFGLPLVLINLFHTFRGSAFGKCKIDERSPRKGRAFPHIAAAKPRIRLWFLKPGVYIYSDPSTAVTGSGNAIRHPQLYRRFFAVFGVCCDRR